MGEPAGRRLAGAHGSRQLSPDTPPAMTGATLRHIPLLMLALFLAPIGAGLVGTLLPAFGYLPAAGGLNSASERGAICSMLPGSGDRFA